jgi:hypothetical protein
MSKLFLSYARADEQCARRLFTDLRNRGLDVWFDQESLLPGQDWKAEIDKAIAETDFVVLLLSNNSVERRGYFLKEVRLTLDVLQTVPFGHIYVLPIRLDDCKVPSTLASLQYVDLFPDWTKGIEKLFKSIELQANIQLSARNAEKTGGPVGASILLVNDEPASMNMAIDIWKSQGFKVDYAFDVSGAIDAIKKYSFSVVISDLSHFSFGQLITDRAGFEILEWAEENMVKLNVIITTYNLTKKRRNEATKLGAAGICNTIFELNHLISTITRTPIVTPEGVFSSGDRSELARSASGQRTAVGLEIKPLGEAYAGNPHLRKSNENVGGVKFINKTVRIICRDEAFLEQLTASLTVAGLRVIDDRDRIATGARWRPELIEADATLIILSNGKEPDWNQNGFAALNEAYRFIWGMPTVRPHDVIPIVVFKVSKSRFQNILRHIKYVDFSMNYESGLEQLIELLKRLPNKIDRGAAR